METREERESRMRREIETKRKREKKICERDEREKRQMKDEREREVKNEKCKSVTVVFFADLNVEFNCVFQPCTSRFYSV